jgi:peptide/nickel transport system substrate-binding protein
MRFMMGEPPTWLDIPTLQFGPTTGFTGWEKTAPDTWRFTVRQGVKFHNGEPFTTEAAAWNITHHGDPEQGHSTISNHGPMEGRVVDEQTVDIVCGSPCPIQPQTLTHVSFQAPEWYSSSPADVRDTRTVSIGPYKFARYEPGQFLEIEAYEDYVPVPSSEVTSRDLHRPYIKNARYVWRTETTVRAAMLATGEADYTYLLDLADIPNVPVAKSMPQMESESFIIDTLWHPMLKQKKFRQALVHAINCREIVDVLFAGTTRCTAVPGTAGMPGVTEENTTYWEYDPELAQQLLKEVNYQGEEIRITGREGRFPKQVEVYEAIAGYWSEVGINGAVEVVERAVWTATRNCGLGNSIKEPADLVPEKINQPPTNCPDPGHLVETAPEWTSLDFLQPAARALDCFAPLSRVCDPEIQTLVEDAGVAPEGPQRAELLQQLANRMKEDVLFIPVFQGFEIHAGQEDLEFEPRPDNRVRVTTMRFK